jgi:hypothetical protein
MDRSKQDCLRMTCPTSLESLKPRKLVKLNKQAVDEYRKHLVPFFLQGRSKFFFKKNQEMGE